MAPPEPRLLTPTFVGLSLAELAYFTAFGLTVYTLPLYVTGPVGSDKAGAGVAFGAFAGAALLARPYAGRLSDQRGRRPLLIFGAALAGLSMMLLGFTQSLALIIVLRMVQGLAEAAFFVAGFAMLADIVPVGRLGEALSYNSLGLYLGIAIGPLLGEVLLQTRDFTTVWLTGAGLNALAAMIVVFLLEAPRPVQQRAPGPLIHRAAIPISLGFCCSLAAVSGFLAFASLRSQEIGLTSTSLALALYGGVVVVVRVAFGKVPDRLPSLPLATGSLVAIGVGSAALALTPSPIGFYVAVVLIGVGVAFSTPAFFAAIFATAAPEQRGAAAGTASAFMDVGLGIGPVVLGLIAAGAGIPWAFGAGCMIALAGATWTAHLTQRPTAQAAA